MGVWIETQSCYLSYSQSCVTPCMGVWIETRAASPRFPASESHPVWVCGLKPPGALPQIWR